MQIYSGHRVCSSWYKHGHQSFLVHFFHACPTLSGNRSYLTSCVFVQFCHLPHHLDIVWYFFRICSLLLLRACRSLSRSDWYFSFWNSNELHAQIGKTLVCAEICISQESLPWLDQFHNNYDNFALQRLSRSWFDICVYNTLSGSALRQVKNSLLLFFWSNNFLYVALKLIS